MEIKLAPISVKFVGGEMYMGTSEQVVDAQIAEDYARQERQKTSKRLEEERRSQLTSHQLAQILLAQPDQAVLVASSTSVVRVGTVIQTAGGIYIGDSEFEPDVFQTSQGLVTLNSESEVGELGDGDEIEGDRLF